jgi:hypothetical protein
MLRQLVQAETRPTYFAEGSLPVSVVDMAVFLISIVDRVPLHLPRRRLLNLQALMKEPPMGAAR